jgi:ABC-2 type transport system permease protein
VRGYAALAAAFVRRDDAIARSYRLAFVLEFGAAAGGALLVYFLARVVDADKLVGAGGTGGAYFPFATVGLTIFTCVSTALLGPTSQLRTDQINGTLEPMMATPTPHWLLIALGSAYAVVRGVGLAIVTLAFTVVVLGLDVAGGISGVLLALLLLIPALLMATGAGLVLASATLVLRKIEHLTSFLVLALSLLCGVYYPTGVLPAALETIGDAIPLTWALSLERAVLLDGDVSQWRLVALLASAVIAMLAGALALRLAFQWSARRGALTHY